MIKIDEYSHIGLDYHNGENNIFDYLNYIKTLEVDIGLVMPKPNPVFFT